MVENSMVYLGMVENSMVYHMLKNVYHVFSTHDLEMVENGAVLDNNERKTTTT